MKIRIALAGIAAVAALSLTACGNDTTSGSAVPGGAGAVAVDTPAAGSDQADTAEPGTSDPVTDDPSSDGDSHESAMPGMPAGCQEMGKLAEDFGTKILQKAIAGDVTQADVDEVFSADNMAKLPAEIKGEADTLKDLANQMVGKKVTELSAVLPKVQTTFQSLAEKVKTVCGG
jgi:hypothetical protein